MTFFSQEDVYSEEFQHAEGLPIRVLKVSTGNGPLNSTVSWKNEYLSNIWNRLLYTREGNSLLEKNRSTTQNWII